MSIQELIKMCQDIDFLEVNTDDLQDEGYISINIDDFSGFDSDYSEKFNSIDWNKIRPIIDTIQSNCINKDSLDEYYPEYQFNDFSVFINYTSDDI